MLGGKEKPCVTKLELKLFPKELGRACPRVELEPGNYALSGLLPYVVREDLRSMAPLVVKEMTREWEPEDRLALFQQLSGTVGNSDVSDELYTTAEERRRREHAEAKKRKRAARRA